MLSVKNDQRYEVGSKSFRPDIQKPRQMENAARVLFEGHRFTSSQMWKVCWNKGRLYWKIAKLFYFCHLKKLVRPKTFGPCANNLYFSLLNNNNNNNNNNKMKCQSDLTDGHLKCVMTLILSNIPPKTEILSQSKRYQVSSQSIQ